MFVMLLVSFLMNERLNIISDGLHYFNNCEWIGFRVAGDGGAIYYASPNGQIKLESCLISNCSCLNSGNVAGGACIYESISAIISKTCFNNCFSDKCTNYRLYSYSNKLLSSTLEFVSETSGKSNSFSSHSGGKNYHYVNNHNSSGNYAPSYFGGLGFNTSPNGVVGAYSQVCNSRVEGLLSFYAGSASLEVHHFNLISNNITQGGWICVHNQNPSLVLRDMIIQKNTAHTSVFLMPGTTHKAAFHNCIIDIAHSSSYFAKCTFTNCTFVTTASPIIYSFHETKQCGEFYKETLTLVLPIKSYWRYLFITILY